MATPQTSSALAKLGPVTHVILRIAAGLLFMPHGAQKLFGAFGEQAKPLFSLMGVAGVVEFFGGLLIVLGLATRPAAAIMFIQMLVAYFKEHAPGGPLPLLNHGELALLYAFVFLFFAGNGAGPASVDAAIARRRGGI